MRMRWKSGKRAPLASELAIGLGSLLLAWGYRRWRRRMKEESPGEREFGDGAEGTEGAERADEATAARARSLSGRWGTLDREDSESHIPKALERMPKGTE